MGARWVCCEHLPCYRAHRSARTAILKPLVGIPQPEKVLILRFSALGDVILTSPAIEALRSAWPQTRILYAVKARLAPVVQHNPNVDEVIPVLPDESPFALGMRLRKMGVGVVLDLHDKLRSKVLRLLLPGPHVVWHKRDFLETVAVKVVRRRPPPARTFLADRYHAAVEQLVGRPLPRGRLSLFLSPGAVERADRKLRAQGVDPDRPMLGMSPGTAWETKRWPVERFGALARRAMAAGYQVVASGEPSEAELYRKLAEAAPGTSIVSLDLEELGGFISRCAAFVANDSGPMHMARALGVPTLAFFGSTDPKMFQFQGHSVLFAGLPCSPCSFFGRRRCPLGHFRCMLDLDVDQAWRSLQGLLSSPGRRTVSA